MSALDFAQAPPLARPLRWLLLSPLWGIAAGAWLAWRGEAVLAGRWVPETAALAHLLALGVLGNAMFGALLQFLPVAAGCPLRLGRAADALHVAFNLGILALAVGLCAPSAGALALAPLLLALTPLGFAWAALPSLLARGAMRAMRSGIAFALAALLATVAAGALAAFALRGTGTVALDRLVDVHASLGLLGWVLGLMAAVGSITQPMFQGARRVPDRALAFWFALAGAALVAGAALRFFADSQIGLALALAVPGALWVLASLLLPMATARRRDAALATFWRAGSIALGAACALAPLAAAGWLSERFGLLAGALALGIGFPLIVTGMLLEISGFLAWIALRRDCPRGLRIPGVGLLVPEPDKRAVLALHLVSALALTAGVLWPEAFARVGGGALVLAHAATLAVLVRALRRARSFRDTLPPANRPHTHEEPQ